MKGRRQTCDPFSKQRVKRDTESGELMDVSQSGEPFKDVRREYSKGSASD